MSLIKQPVKNIMFLTGFFILVIFVAGCESQQTTSASLSGVTMGTTYHVTISTPISLSDSTEIQKDIDGLLLKVNDSFSTYIESSEVSKFNQYSGEEGQIKSDNFIEVLLEALRISVVTQGAYDITVGPLVNLWGFGPDFKADNIPNDMDIEVALASVGYQAVIVNQKSNNVKKSNQAIYIDFSSLAKGFGVDKVAELLESKGYKNFMVEIGGEMLVRGVNPQGNNWRIAVEKPDSSKRAIHRVINITNTAIATSGDYRNYFEKDGVKFSHTINPRTGRPVQHDLASVTVLAKNSMTADAWATAFMVLGDKRGYDLAMANKLAVLFLVKDGEDIKEVMTPSFQVFIEGH